MEQIAISTVGGALAKLGFGVTCGERAPGEAVSRVSGAGKKNGKNKVQI